MLGLHPVIHVPNYMDHYSLTDPWGWMGELAMLADQQQTLNHKVVTHPASSLVQDRKSSPAETSVLTTMLYHQLTGTARKWGQLSLAGLLILIVQHLWLDIVNCQILELDQSYKRSKQLWKEKLSATDLAAVYNFTSSGRGGFLSIDLTNRVNVILKQMLLIVSKHWKVADAWWYCRCFPMSISSRHLQNLPAHSKSLVTNGPGNECYMLRFVPRNEWSREQKFHHGNK